MKIPFPPDEAERIAALKRYDILDTPPEEIFDRITRMLSDALDVPIALVSLVDETRQWFKSRHGLGVESTPRELAFCAHAIVGETVLVVPDATKDERFADNPFVTGDPHIRFYAGVPLRTRDGFNLGTLSAIDIRPRELTAEQRRTHETLAQLVVDVLDLRRVARNVVENEHTARSAAERRRLESEDRFADVANSIPGVVYQLRIDGQGRMDFPYISPTIKQVLGVEAADVMADSRVWYETVHPDDRAELNASIERTRQTLEPWAWEGRVAHAEGGERWFRGTAIPRRGEGDTIVWNGFVLDVTELKRTEEQLRQVQKLEAIGQLTGGVAHDFNNLLAVIQGNAELLAGDNDIPDRKIEAILRAARRGAELTQRLLAFSRRQPLRPRAVDLAMLVEGMHDLLARSLGENITIESRIEPNLWAAQADAGQVESALLNLALNARDAMPGGGRLTIACNNVSLSEAPVPEDAEAETGDYVMLSVADSGTGMTTEVLKHAFEPFFTTKEVGQGSGLGLSMVYGFAKQSGGFAAVSSAGKGATVKIYLPRAVEEPQVENKESGDEPRGQGELILVIEDDTDLRAVTAASLSGLGYRTVVATDAVAARAVLEGCEAVDLILSDVVLPGGVSGPEYAEEVRRAQPGLPVVFMSGHATEVSRRNDFLGSGDILLNKPFRRPDLARALVRALGRDTQEV